MGNPFLGMQHRLYDVKLAEDVAARAHQFEVHEHMGRYRNLPCPRIGVHIPNKRDAIPDRVDGVARCLRLEKHVVVKGIGSGWHTRAGPQYTIAVTVSQQWPIRADLQFRQLFDGGDVGQDARTIAPIGQQPVNPVPKRGMGGQPSYDSGRVGRLRTQASIIPSMSGSAALPAMIRLSLALEVAARKSFRSTDSIPNTRPVVSMPKRY